MRNADRAGLPRVLIAGSTGFIGRALAARLQPDHYVVGLSRVAGRPAVQGGFWCGAVDELRACDLHSPLATEKAVQGVDYAYYLVHSMMPATRLSQGDFWDFDLIAADNFGRAARAAGVKQIIYLGGLVPGGDTLSRHLKSRLEVEQALGAHGVPVTALRAGMVIGASGPSFLTMVKTVQNAPVILCPEWADTISHPIALDDVVHLLAYCLGNAATAGRTFDVGGPELMSYRTMLRTIARSLGVQRVEVPFPFASARLIQAGISLFSGAPAELVAPLVESLRHPIVARDRALNEMAGLPGTPYTRAIDQAVKDIVSTPARGCDRPVAFQRRRVDMRAAPTVRSAQRFVLPPGRHADWVAQEFFHWLPQRLAPLLDVRSHGSGYSIALKPFERWPLLSYERWPERSRPERELFMIRGLLLAPVHPGARVEFREVLGGTAVLIALHDFAPRLPWYLYCVTQAQLHLLVMHCFSRHLEGIARKEMTLAHFFGALQQGLLTLAEIDRQRIAGGRLPRAKIEPLHDMAFELQAAGRMVCIANVSAGGIGFIKCSLEDWPPAGTVVHGRLRIGGSAFDVAVKLLHTEGAVVGGSFEHPAPALVAKIGEYLRSELAALNMVCVPRPALRDDPDGTPCWFHGTSSCDLYLVERMGRILRFHLLYFGHYLEGGAGRPLRYGYVVAEPDEASPTKGPALVRWGRSINAESLSTAIRLVQNIRDLSPGLRQGILNLIC